MDIFIGLVHFPVFDRHGDRICSAITNLDIHDIARTATTYGASGLFIITPSGQQQELDRSISSHWLEGVGGRFNPDRKRAFDIVKIVPDLGSTLEGVREISGREPVLLATSARDLPGCVSWKNFEKRVYKNEFECILLLFGTASGLHQECIDQCDVVICPVSAGTDYNHLSVRSAVAIVLDRISRFGRKSDGCNKKTGL